MATPAKLQIAVDDKLFKTGVETGRAEMKSKVLEALRVKLADPLIKRTDTRYKVLIELTRELARDL